MPNSLAPFGFRPVRHMSALGQELNKYLIDPTVAQTIAIGDPVKSDGNGGILLALPGDAILGTFEGAHIETMGQFGGSQNFAASGQIPFFKVWNPAAVALPPGSSVVAVVHDDPNITFEVQTSGTITQADIGGFVDLVAGTPDPIFGTSRATISGPSGAGTTFQVTRIYQKPMRNVDVNNNTLGFSLSTPGQYALCEVKCVKHERGGPAMAIAV